MTDFLLPRTDGGVLVQLVGAAVVYSVSAVALRKNHDLLLFVIGLATITAAFFAVRTMH